LAVKTVSRIVLAGRIAIHAGDTTVDERLLPGRQPRLVFAMLVVERHRPVSREELADNLWPERAPPTWDSALRVVVSRVRRFVAASGIGTPDTLCAQVGGYRLQLEDVGVDLEQAVAAREGAEAVLASGDAGRATRLATEARAVFARPLLSGIDGPWVEAQRRELAMELMRALEVLATAQLQLGQSARARTAAEAVIGLDPFRELAHRLLIRAELVAGDLVAGLRAYERLRVLLAEELGVDPSPETQALHVELLRHTASPARVEGPASPPGPSQLPSDAPPYLGLRSFDERDAARFFGRSADVSRLLDRLDATRFLAVLGASGSGKSSLVRAGLVPALRRGVLPGSDSWAIQVLRPGATPLERLADALVDLDGHLGLDTMLRRLERDEAGLHDLVAQAVQDGLDADRVLFVVDQFEEVFTLCSDTTRRQAFVAALTTAAIAPGGRTFVVATLRADFYPRLAEHPLLSDLASSHQFLVTPMDEVGLGAAIEGPAHAAGLSLEPGLTETILRDVARRPGALPMLGQALLELWQRRAATTLTLEGYRAAGGVEGAIAQRAEAVHAELTAEEQSVARRILLRLTQPGEGTEATRRRVALSELVTRPEDRQRVERVVDRLTTARLLTAGRDADSEPYVEISHEALIRGWPRLQAWIDEDRSGLMIHRRLTEAATEWQRLERDDDALYRGARLALAAEWAERGGAATNPLERDFLAASIAAREAQRRARLRRLRLTASSLGVGLLITAALAVFALAQSARVDTEVRVATARELAAAAVANLEADPERSILLALEAVEVTRDAEGTVVREAEEALHQALHRSRLVSTLPQGGWAAAVTSDGGRVVTTGSSPDDHTATVWDIDSGLTVLELTGPDVGRATAVFSPDDRLIATGHNDGTVHLWNATTGQPLRVLRGHEGELGYTVFTPDGRGLVTGSEDRTVRLWDVTTGKETLRITDRRWWPHWLAVSPDGTRLAVGFVDDADIALYDLVTGEPVTVLAGHDWSVTGVAFSPDGDRLASVSVDGIVRLWNVDAGEVLRTFTSPAGLSAVSFSPDGSRLATGGDNGIVRVWHVDSGEEMLTLPGHTGFVANVAFTPDGNRLFSAAFDDTTRLWDISVTGARNWLTVPTATGIFTRVAFSPDGTSFAAPVDPAGVTIWDVQTGAEIITLTGHDSKLTTVAFSPDGRRLVASSDLTETPPIWDVATGELLDRLEGHDAPVRAVAFSPDGDRIATGGRDGTLRLWDRATGSELAMVTTAANDVDAVGWSPDGRFLVAGGAGRFGDAPPVEVRDARTLELEHQLHGHQGAVEDLAFGPDGLLVTSGGDATARLWDLESASERLVLRGHQAIISGVAVSPDGARIATASDDGTTRLWDATSGEEVLTLHGHRALVFGVAFSPDGRLLATASADGTVALHLLPIDELVTVARERVTRELTDAECDRFLHVDACPAPADT
jgi:WD40 repeat protein/DNA-binding SARP family transcriptional activator